MSVEKTPQTDYDMKEVIRNLDDYDNNELFEIYEKENNISGQGEGNKSEQTEKNAQKPQLEPWMVDGAFWKIKNNKNNTNRISSVFTEKREQLENWMLTEKNFKVIDPYLSEESLLERWMLNSNNFKTVEQIETDKIQKWMIEAENWNI